MHKSEQQQQQQQRVENTTREQQKQQNQHQQQEEGGIINTLHQHPNFEAGLALLIYSICSVSMILLNKLVMDTYKIDFPLGLLFLQNASALILVMTAKALGWIHYPAFDMSVVKKWLPLTFFFVLMLWTSMKSLRTMSVAAVTILKNLAIVFTAIGDWFWFQKSLSKEIFFVFVLMIFGSYLGSANDKWVTSDGLFWTFANIFCTVSYVLYMKALLGSVQNEIGKYGPVFYNNLLSLPFLLFPALPSLPGLKIAIEDSPSSAKLCLLMMLFISAIMTFGTFWAMRATSPTTYSVTGALNKIPLAFLGIFIFHNYPSFLGYVGISCALGAGVIYAKVMSFLNAQQQKQEDNSSSDASSSSSPIIPASPLTALVVESTKKQQEHSCLDSKV